MAPTSPYVAWSGALQITVNGIAMPISVKMFSRVQKKRTDSFKQLAPSGMPAVQGPPIDSATGETFDKVLIRKGIEVAKDEYIPAPPEAIAAIGEGTKSTVVPPLRFAPVDTIRWDMAIDRFAVRPNDKAPGSAEALQVLWNGLVTSGTAYVTQITLRAGGMDSILAVYGDDNGLWAAVLPFEDELYSIPTICWNRDEHAGSLMALAIEQEYDVEPFDHKAYSSEYRARRNAIIEQVLAGEDIEKVEKPKITSGAPDLMSLLSKVAEKQEVVA